MLALQIPVDGEPFPCVCEIGPIPRVGQPQHIADSITNRGLGEVDRIRDFRVGESFAEKHQDRLINLVNVATLEDSPRQFDSPRKD